MADDDVLLREGIARILSGAGYEVVAQAADRAELEDLVREHVPDLVVVDIRMPPTQTTEGLDTHDLVVSVAHVDEGPTMKRWRPRAQGRATRINKRTSHITLVVQPASVVSPERVKPAKKAAAKTAEPAKKTAAKKTTTKKTAAKKSADTTGEDA